MALTDHSRLLRGVGLLACVSLAYSTSAMGVNAVVLTAAGKLKQHRRPPPRHSHHPSPVFLGEAPKRDPIKRTVWTDGDLFGSHWPDFGTLVAATDDPVGSQLPSHTTVVDADSGGNYPWEGSTGGCNTSTGNKLTTVRLLGWTVKGGQDLNFTLYHNSESTYDGELGHNWSWTYDVFVNTTTGNPVIHWGDGMCVPYSASGGSYTAPAGIYDHLVRNTDGTWTITKKDGAVYALDSSGYLTRVTDRNGYSISLTLNAQHYVTRIGDPTGRYVNVTVTNGKFQSITDHTGRTWSFAYDSNDNLQTVTWPSLGDGNTYSDGYTYNAGHCILTHTDRRGKTWSSTYNADGSIASETDPLNHTTTYAYTTSTATITDPLGHARVDNYTNGVLASSVDENGYSTGYTARDANKNPTTIVDKRGKTWTYTYDSKGNVLSATDPLSHTRTITYNAYSQPLTVTDPLSHTKTYTYDGAGNLLTEVDALGKTLQTNTYAGGLLQTATDALSKTTTVTYDTNGLPSTVTDPLSHTTTYVYDSLSRLASRTDALGHAETVGFDAWDRATSLTHEGGATIGESFDPTGNVLTYTDELGHTTTYAYDDAGRLTSKTNARGDLETYGYDLANRQTSVTNGRGKTRTYAYTNRGETYSLTYPDGTVETWTHDGEQNTTGYTNGQNETTTYVFDDAGRTTGKSFPDGSSTTYSYDNADRMTGMVDASGTTSWTYDAADQVTTEVTPQVTANYTYDDAGRRLTRQEAGSGTNTYVYDDADRLTTTTNLYNETSIDTYDDADRVIRRTFSTGAYDEFGYDGRNRMTSIVRKKSDGTAYSSESYVWDDANNLSSKTVDGTTTTYGYDNIDQLTSESRTGYSASYTYDANGNRLSKTLNGVAETYTYDDGDKLLSTTGGPNPRTFGYDGCGRTHTVTSGGGTTTYAWNYEDQMVGVQYPNGATNSATYNGFGARASLVDSAGTWNFRRDGADVTDPVTYDHLSGRYTPGISYHASNSLKEIHQDYLGTYGLVTDSTQSIVLSRTYDAFGNQLSSTGSAPPYMGWAGAYGYYRQRDNNLLLVGHRMYDPTIGRFLTRDPAYDGRNWYGYCENNPLKLVDPEGLLHIVVSIGPNHDGVLKVYADPGDNYYDDRGFPCRAVGGQLLYTCPVSNHPSGHAPFPSGTFPVTGIGHGRGMGPNWVRLGGAAGGRGTWIHSGRGDKWKYPTHGCIRGRETDINHVCGLIESNPDDNNRVTR